MKDSLSFRKQLVGAQSELYRFAFKLTSNSERAHDLLQETSLKVLSSEDKYTEDINFRGWVYAIMRNTFINNYRKVIREPTFVDQIDKLCYLNFSQESFCVNIEKIYDLKEMCYVVGALPEEYRRPFTLYVSGFKYREISDKLQLPIGTIKSRIFFTRRKLQKLLKDFR